MQCFSYSNKITLLLGWSDRYKKSTVVITIWWPLRNIHISDDNESFTFCVDIFIPLSLPRLLSVLTVFLRKTTGVFNKANVLPFMNTWVHLSFVGEVSVVHLFSCLCCFCCCSEFHLMMSDTIPHYTPCSILLYFKLFVGGLTSYIRLYLLTFSIFYSFSTLSNFDCAFGVSTVYCIGSVDYFFSVIYIFCVICVKFSFYLFRHSKSLLCSNIDISAATHKALFSP